MPPAGLQSPVTIHPPVPRTGGGAIQQCLEAHEKAWVRLREVIFWLIFVIEFWLIGLYQLFRVIHSDGLKGRAE